MFHWIKGKIKEKNKRSIILAVDNLGYEIFITDLLLKKIKLNQEIELYTLFYWRENVLELYGFTSKEELGFFRKLISISGIGPKSALTILSLTRLEELKKAISRKDASFLTKVSGIGRKTAERIVLELSRSIKVEDSQQTDTETQVLDALRGLGYSLAEARKALGEVPENVKEVEERVRMALRRLSR
jgi:Holliday junction DNA helicase RuvA